MSHSRPPAGPSLSGTLRNLARSRKVRLSLGDLVAPFEGQGGLGQVLFVLALPVLLPLPPGASMALALPLLIVAPKIVAGRDQLWLPGWLARRKFDRAAFTKLVGRVLTLLERIEALGRPRISILTGPMGERAGGRGGRHLDGAGPGSADPVRGSASGAGARSVRPGPDALGRTFGVGRIGARGTGRGRDRPGRAERADDRPPPGGVNVTRATGRKPAPWRQRCAAIKSRMRWPGSRATPGRSAR